MARRNQFYGVVYDKAGRRQNRPDGSPRKYYPYPTAEQVGTPIEKVIRNKSSDLIEQFNAMPNHPNGLEMRQSEATGSLHSMWGSANNRLAKDHMRNNGGTAAAASATILGGAGVIHFGADPKSK